MTDCVRRETRKRDDARETAAARARAVTCRPPLDPLYAPYTPPIDPLYDVARLSDHSDVSRVVPDHSPTLSSQSAQCCRHVGVFLGKFRIGSLLTAWKLRRFRVHCSCKSTPKWALIGETNNEEALPSYAGDMCEGRLIRMGLVGVPREVYTMST